MSLIQTFALFTLLFIHTHGQILEASPCPRLFVYEGKSDQPDRWYGIVTLLSETDLTGVWLFLMFDRPSLLLGNWFGEAAAKNGNMNYLIKNRTVILKAYVPQTVRFFVKYDTSQPPPKLTGFRMNGKTLCPRNANAESSTSVAELQTSGVLLPVTESGANVEIFTRPGGGRKLGQSHFTEDDDSYSSNSVATVPPLQNSVNVNLKEICGTVVSARPLITHGLPTSEGEYPWHAAVYRSKGLKLLHWCGGSLVSTYHIITVAHCVTKWGTNIPRSTNSFIIYLGKYYLKRFTEGIQERLVAEIVPHPKYDLKKWSNDLAIVKFTKPVEITEYVRPICLWQGPIDLNLLEHKEGTVVGWGFDETGKLTERLMQAKMPIVSTETCIYSLPTFYPLFLTNTTYCAGFANGTSVCNGDSGGGMIFSRPSSDGSKVTWQLRGLVSLSADSGNKFKCDTTHYVIFTDVAKYLDWIERLIQ